MVRMAADCASGHMSYRRGLIILRRVLLKVDMQRVELQEPLW